MSGARRVSHSISGLFAFVLIGLFALFALAIVVSEERGQVSVARDGELRPLADVAELTPILFGYLREKFPRRQGRRLTRLVTHNLREKIIAVVLALGLWGISASTAAADGGTA